MKLFHTHTLLGLLLAISACGEPEPETSSPREQTRAPEEKPALQKLPAVEPEVENPAAPIVVVPEVPQVQLRPGELNLGQGGRLVDAALTPLLDGYAAVWSEREVLTWRLYFQRVTTDGTVLGDAVLMLELPLVSGLGPRFVPQDLVKGEGLSLLLHAEDRLSVTVLRFDVNGVLDPNQVTLATRQGGSAFIVQMLTGPDVFFETETGINHHSSDAQKYLFPPSYSVTERALAVTEGAVTALLMQRESGQHEILFGAGTRCPHSTPVMTEAAGRQQTPVRLTWNGTHYALLWTATSRDNPAARDVFLTTLMDTYGEVPTTVLVKEGAAATDVLGDMTPSAQGWTVGWAGSEGGVRHAVLLSSVGASSSHTLALGSELSRNAPSPALAVASAVNGTLGVLWAESPREQSDVISRCGAPARLHFQRVTTVEMEIRD